jgi:hypothetical protein
VLRHYDIMQLERTRDNHRELSLSLSSSPSRFAVEHERRS